MSALAVVTVWLTTVTDKLAVTMERVTMALATTAAAALLVTPGGIASAARQVTTSGQTASIHATPWFNIARGHCIAGVFFKKIDNLLSLFMDKKPASISK